MLKSSDQTDKLRQNVVDKCMRYLPCKIRFVNKPKPGSIFTYKQQTGILFKCEYPNTTQKQPFVLKILFKNPLHRHTKTSKTNQTGIQIIDILERQYVVMSLYQFTMICYYMWDEALPLANPKQLHAQTSYTRDPYHFTEIELSPTAEDSKTETKWARTDCVFPFAKRFWNDKFKIPQFLHGHPDLFLPEPNIHLKYIVDKHKHNELMQPQGMLYGRAPSSLVHIPPVKKQKQKILFSKKKRKFIQDINCPGCKKCLYNREAKTDMSQSCCQIQICQVTKNYMIHFYCSQICFDIFEMKWKLESPTSCFGSFLNCGGRYFDNKLPIGCQNFKIN